MINKIFTSETWKVFIFFILPGCFPSTSSISDFLLAVWGAVFAYVVYTLGNMLYRKLPAMHGLNIKTFNFNFFFALCYLILALFTFGGYTIDQNNFSKYGWPVYLIILFHLYCMYAIFYCIYFIARSIATIEHNKVAKFEDYVGNFFLLWLFPIGVWWMHPKVRRIFSENI